jgi:hypothetical protein
LEAAFGAGFGEALRVGFAVDLGRLERVFSAAFFGAALAAERPVTRARDAWPRARDGFFDGLLEELTPELSDLPNRVGSGLQSYDGRLGGDL